MSNNSKLFVICRDGSQKPLDVNKIRTVINWATKGFNVNSLELEGNLTARLKPGITTKEIQDNLINCSLELCSPNESDWRYVAGRLHIWSLWKNIKVLRNGTIYGNFLQIIKEKVANGEYSSLLIDVYSDEELETASHWLNMNFDTNYDYAGAILLTDRYLLKNELPQEAFLISALLIASIEEPNRISEKNFRLELAHQIYLAIVQRKISLATPILANLRKPKGSVSSCFITTLDDNLESIFNGIHNVARISKNGGGVGVNVSRIRATGSTVMGKPNASKGILPWIKLLNDTAIAVDQAGNRAGAVTVSLDIWHLDIPEFLEIQTEQGDQRRKSFDIFPQLVISDEFMRRVRNDELWTLVDPYEVKEKLLIDLPYLWGNEFEKQYRTIEATLNMGISNYKQVSARSLFKQIMRTQLETGMPYLWFKDTVNMANPNQHEGMIPCGNLCQESYSNVVPDKLAHTCNLVSINLANIADSYELEKCCTLAVRILDNTIDLTYPPFEASLNHNQRYRTIGVGAMGLADWLAKRQFNYSSLNQISYLFEDFGYFCTKASMELAKERGSYPAYQGSEWSKGNLIGAKPLNWFLQFAHQPERFVKLRDDIQTYGIRNSHITAIAPNTSSSLIQGCTASVLPVYSKFFYDQWAKGTVPIAPPFIKDYFWFYQESKNLNQMKVINAVATIQQWIDTGISMELIFNLNEGIYFSNEPQRSLTAQDIYDCLMEAWELGCKAIYYIRTVQKDNFKESKNECVSCAN